MFDSGPVIFHFGRDLCGWEIQFAGMCSGVASLGGCVDGCSFGGSECRDLYICEREETRSASPYLRTRTKRDRIAGIGERARCRCPSVFVFLYIISTQVVPSSTTTTHDIIHGISQHS